VIIALGDIYAQIPYREQVRELMRATQVRMREQPGCLAYEFAETLEDPGHFLVVQQWEDRAALDAHYRSQEFADYQASIRDRLVRDSDLRAHVVQETVRLLGVSPADPRLDD
jgi:quinol monooxygenase YgiN